MNAARMKMTIDITATKGATEKWTKAQIMLVRMKMK
jgi:hypothetical protein|tara:strand:- start:3972 stop:4079 length:108 start_codon:yes stop_codon:yes gene_type:complete